MANENTKIWTYPIKVLFIFLLLSFNTEAQRHRVFLTELTGLTRLGNESLLSDKIILTQRGKGAEEDVVSNLNNHTFKHSNIQTFEHSNIRKTCLSSAFLWGG